MDAGGNCGSRYDSLQPPIEVDAAGDDGGRELVALGDQVVQVFLGRRTKGFESEVIDDEQRHARQRSELAVAHGGGPCGVQALREGHAAGEDDVRTLPRGAVAQGLRQMALAEPLGLTNSTHRCLLVQATPVARSCTKARLPTHLDSRINEPLPHYPKNRS